MSTVVLISRTEPDVGKTTPMNSAQREDEPVLGLYILLGPYSNYERKIMNRLNVTIK